MLLRPPRSTTLYSSAASDVYKRQVLHIQRSINEYNEITSGKNDNAKRSVYLVSAAKNAWDLISSNVDGDDLFPGVSQQTYRYHLKRFCIDHQFSHFVTPYGLRHTFVSLAKTLPAGLCLLYTSPSPRDRQKSRMPSSA